MQPLYHYTSFNTYKKISSSNSLLFLPTKGTNDPFEIIKNFHSSYGLIPESTMEMLLNELKKYRQISLTMDFKDWEGYASPMMWGHYGDSYKGVCLELDADKLSLNLLEYFAGPISYQPLTELEIGGQDLSDITKVDAFIKQHMKQLFFTKHPSWAPENEFRIVTKVKDGEQKFLDISKALTCIYLPVSAEENYEKIKQLVPAQTKVFLLRAKDENGFLKLGPENPENSKYLPHIFPTH